MDKKPLWTGAKSQDEFYRQIALEYYETGTTIKNLAKSMVGLIASHPDI